MPQEENRRPEVKIGNEKEKIPARESTIWTIEGCRLVNQKGIVKQRITDTIAEVTRRTQWVRQKKRSSTSRSHETDAVENVKEKSQSRSHETEAMYISKESGHMQESRDERID